MTTVALAVLCGVLGITAPAAAADQVGWLRVTPAAGTIDTAMDALTEKACPGGTHVVATVTGPGIPSTGDIGNILGNTNIDALPPTESGQLYVPLQYTLRDWFGRNVPGAKPQGTYTVSVICRDAFRSTVTFGSFDAQVAIAANGGYRALGEAAKPFDTTRKTEELPGVVVPDSTASAAPAPSASAAGETPAASPTPSGAASAPATVPPTSEPQGSTTPDALAAPTSPATSATPAEGSSSSWLPLALVGVGAVVLIGAFLVSRRRPQPAGGHQVDQSPESERVSS
jgi:hypothetical protein